MSEISQPPSRLIPIVMFPIVVAVFIAIRTPSASPPVQPEIPSEHELPPRPERPSVRGVAYLHSGAVFADGLLSIYYAVDPSRASGEVSQMRILARVRTDPDGGFAVRGVLPNRELVFRGDGVTGEARWTVGAKDASGVQIRLKR